MTAELLEGTTPGLTEQVKAARQREIQMIGAAISNRSWHDLERAYNQLRDKVDGWIIIAARSGIEAQHGLNDVFPGDPVKVRASDLAPTLATENARLQAEVDGLLLALAQTPECCCNDLG